jgi:hypothetical protein
LLGRGRLGRVVRFCHGATIEQRGNRVKRILPDRT